MTTYKIVWEVGAVIIVVATIALWINPKLAKYTRPATVGGLVLWGLALLLWLFRA